MMWAKGEKKGIFHHRAALMAMYTVGICMLSLTAFAETPTAIKGDYRITLAEAEKRIAEELMQNGAGDNVEANILGRRSEDLVRRAEPVVMEVVDLQADKTSQRFTATLNFSTEADLNRPARVLGNLVVAGRYDEVLEVPVVKYRIAAGEIIREEDIEWKKLPSNRARRDIVLEAEMIIGKSPVRSLSPDRPIRTSEVQAPAVIQRNAPVKMSYKTDHITIQAVGTAMVDGAIGDRIKVRNDDSGILVDAMVTDRGLVEVMPAYSAALAMN